MPQRTIASGGGLWNSTATWVEGAVPTSSDYVVGNSSSGQLTINVAAACQYLDLSAYTQTITFNGNITVGLAGGTTTFGSGMNFNAGTGGQIIFSTTNTIAQNTTNRIPNLAFNGTSTKTLSTNLYCNNFSNSSSSFRCDNNIIYVGGNMIYPGATTISNGIFGTTNWVLDGSGLISASFGPGPTTRTITITGNYETTGSNLYLFEANTFIYTAGTAGSNFNLLIGRGFSSLSSSNTINVNQPTIKLFLIEEASNIGGIVNTINLNGVLNVDYIGCYSKVRTYTTDAFLQEFQFIGNSVSANTLNLIPVFRSTSSQTYPTASGSTTYRGVDITFDYLYTHSIGSLQLNGGGIPNKPVIKSNSSGNQVAINLRSKITSQIIDYNFTDVNASGGQQIVAINGTLSNTTNITNVYPTGSGGGETAYTFAS